MTRTVKTIVEETLGFQRAKTLWTANYYPALPITPNSFDVGAVLPAILYMMRWGYRRGKGKFIATFGRLADGKTQSPTISDVATGLLIRADSALDKFNDETGQAVLGDLLLTWCLENRKHAEGHTEQVQRIYATHYMASWVDLPDTVGHLRGVPELLTSLLADQGDGEWLEPGKRKGGFPVGVAHSENRLLSLYGRHMKMRGPYASNLASDTFDEDVATDIGIDELLAVRLAGACGSAPLKAKGKDESERIHNRHPLAERAAVALREDMAIFIEVYGGVVPRQAFMQMLEAEIGLGVTALLLSTLSVLSTWEQTGRVPEGAAQIPWPLFVDASQGQEKALRELSEASVMECLRRFERFPVLMMLLRVLDDRVRNDRKLREQLPPVYPDSAAFVNLLGDIYQGQHSRAEAVFDALDEDCQRLAEGLDAELGMPDMAQRLRNGRINPALRLAEVLCELMGDKQQRRQFMKILESTLMTDRPNGLAIKRRVRRSEGGVSRAVDLRAIVLTSPLLDFLVHRHLRKAAKGKPFHPLSLQEFLKLLRERYGLYVDREPPGHAIPQELLRRNRVWLERRLRDLGLLIGVNDAESMKQLKSRYRAEAPHAA
jgi:hypothetical protein